MNPLSRQFLLLTIAGHPGDDLAIGTLNSVFKQAGIKKSMKQ